MREALPRFFHAEGTIFSEEIALTPFKIEMKVPVTEEVSGIIHGFKRAPGGIGKSLHHSERGVVPEQLAPIRTVKLDPEPLVPEVVAGIIPRLEGNGVPACQPLDHPEGRVGNVQLRDYRGELPQIIPVADIMIRIVVGLQGNKFFCCRLTAEDKHEAQYNKRIPGFAISCCSLLTGYGN
jgi:hypothetical protein